MNQVNLKGSVSKVQVFGSGDKKVTNITISFPEKEKKADGSYGQRWNYIQVVYFGQNNFNEKDQVIVNGKLSQNVWKGKDGKKNYQIQIVASDIVKLQ